VHPKPVLFCSHVVEWGGAETVLADLLAGLDRDRWTPHLACPGPGPLATRADELEVAVHTIPIGGGHALTKAAGLPRAARAIRRLAGRIGARLVYANTMIAGYAGVLAQRRDLACLWHVHIVTTSRLARLAAARAHTIVTPSAAGAAALGTGARLRRPIHVVQNGVPEAFFTASGSSLRTGLGLASDAPLLGIVGRIAPDKGHEVLLRACATLGDVPHHLAVVGTETFADSQPGVRGHLETLRALATELGIDARVHWLGHRDDLPDLLHQLDVVVCPSTAAESAPRAVAEAQASACAVIASDIGGTGEMIRDGHTGLLLPPGDIGALATALRHLLGDAPERQRLATAARAHARASYPMQAFTRRIGELCEQTLNQG